VTATGIDETELRHLLSSRGAVASAVRRVDPSLEDVFVGVVAENQNVT
jgi:hypothetical protein